MVSWESRPRVIRGHGDRGLVTRTNNDDRYRSQTSPVTVTVTFGAS